MAVLGICLRRKIGPYGGKALWKSAIQSFMASVIMGIAVWLTAQGLEQGLDMSYKAAQIGQVLVSVGVGTVVYTVMVLFLRMEEAQTVVRIVKRKLHR